MSKNKQTLRTRYTTVFAALISAAGLWCATPSAYAQAQVTTGSVFNVFPGGKITLGDTANTQAYCNPSFYDSPKLNVLAPNLLGTTQCKNAASSTPTTTALITASGGNAGRMSLPAFQGTTNPLDVNYANGAQVLVNNGSTSNTLNGDGQLAVTSAGQTLTLKTLAGVLNLPAGEYARVNLQVNKVLHFQAGAGATRIKQLNLSNCNGTSMEFEPGDYYIENASWSQSCHLKVAAATGGNTNTSVKLYFKNAFNLGSGPTCWNITGGTTCGNSMTPAQIAAQTPDKLKVYLYSGNFTTSQGAQIAAGIYVDQGDVTLTAANNFVFTGDLFANNISIANGGPTSLLYKPVLTSIIPPANSTPPSVSLTQPVPPALQGVPANSNFIAPAAIPLTATATPATGSGNTISQVQFYQGSTIIGTATAPTTANGNNYSISWTNVAANSYSVTAKATDNKSNTASSTPITVNVINNTPPTISLTASPANATAPATIILNAQAADTDGTVAKVEFFNGSTSIATVTQAPFTTNWANVATGNYSITAKATDNLGATTTSAPAPVVVAAYQPKVYDIYTDHIDTPRVITDASGNEVWRWDSAPFGETLPNEQPTQATSKFRFNFRFPGQYYDSETNLHYNYYRDYDPQGGRYIQSDPIGLNGGINTYAYVSGRPFEDHDRFGLQAGTMAAGGAGATGAGAGAGATGAGTGAGAGAVTGGTVTGGSTSGTTSTQVVRFVFGRAANEATYATTMRAGAGLLGSLAVGITAAIWPSNAGEGSDKVPQSSTEQDRGIWTPEKQPGYWSCKARADCNDNIPGNCPEDPKRRVAYGGGIAKDQGTARNIAKNNATANLQCQPKHVSCKCMSPKGVVYSGGC